MSLLSNLNLVKSKTKTEKIFEKLFQGKTFLDIEYNTPSEYVSKYWNAYKNLGTFNNAINGKIFELIISTLFVREGIFPMYIQAKVAFIPNVDYDLIIFNKEIGPISISLKTSLRERKKQADLEAIALKYVHRKSKSYLISLDLVEVQVAKKDLENGYLLGIDNVIFADSSEFDDFIRNLKEVKLSEAGSIEIIESNQIVSHNLVSMYGIKR